jgi:hypothetical protein
MPASQLQIDHSTIFDNIDDRQVEFDAIVDDEEYSFAVQYDVLEALTGDVPDGDAAILFNEFIDPISDAALSALSRDTDRPIIVVSGNDLD